VNYLTADYFTLKNDYVGYFTVSGDFEVTQDTALDGNLVVNANVVLNATAGNTVVMGNVYAMQNMYVYGDDTIYGNLYLQQALNIGGDVDIGGNLTVEQNNFTLGHGGSGAENTYVTFKADPTVASLGLNLHLQSDTATPQATLDVLGNRNNTLNLYTFSPQNLNVLAQNVTHQGLAVYTDASTTVMGIYNEPGSRVPAVPTGDMGQMDLSMAYVRGGDFNVGVGLSGNINLRSRLSVTNHASAGVGGSAAAIAGQHTVFDETAVVYDTSAGPFLYRAYETADNVYTAGHAMTWVADNATACTMTQWVNGGTAATTAGDGVGVGVGVEGLVVGGGSYVLDASRSMGMVGVLGWAYGGLGSNTDIPAGGDIVPTQTMVSGNSCVQRRSTLGINTYAPATERYGLHVNGPVWVQDADVTLVQDAASNELTGMTLGRRKGGQAGVAWGTPAVLQPPFPLGNVYATANGGQSWTDAQIHATPYEIGLSLRGGMVYDPSYSLLCGDSGVGLYSDNGGSDYYTLDFTAGSKNLQSIQWMYLNRSSTSPVMVTMVSSTTGTGASYGLSYFVLSSIEALSQHRNPVTGQFTVPQPSAGVAYCSPLYNQTLGLPDTTIGPIRAVDGYDASYVFICGSGGVQKWNMVAGMHLDASGHLVDAGGNPVTRAFLLPSGSAGNVHNPGYPGNSTVYNAIQTYRVYDSDGGLLPDPLWTVAVGQFGIVSSTHDAGATWKDTVLTDDAGRPIQWQSVFIYDASNAVIVGEGGAVGCTKNGGISWQRVPSAVFNANGVGGTLINDASYTLTSVIVPNRQSLVVAKRYQTWTTSTTSGPTRGHSKLFYAYVPDLLDHANHVVMDICGSMHLSGDAYVYDNLRVSLDTHLDGNLTVAVDISGYGNLYCGNHTVVNYLDDFSGNILVGTGPVGGKYIQISGGAPPGSHNTVVIGGASDELTLQGNLQLAGTVSTTANKVQLLKGSILSGDSGGAGVYVRDFNKDSAGYLAVNSQLDGWLVKPTGAGGGATVVNLATQTMNLALPGARDIMTGAPMRRALVWVQASDVAHVDSSYSVVMGNIDASNVFLKDSTDSLASPNNQVISTNVEVSGNTLIVRGVGDSVGGLGFFGNRTGAFQTYGGGSIGGNLWLGGNLVVNSDRECAAGYGDGALAVGGGASFGGNCYVGGNTAVVGTMNVGKDTTLSANTYVGGNLSVASRFDATDPVGFSKGAVVVQGGASLGGNLYSGGNVYVGGAVESAGLGLGALIVARGGASVAGNIVVGGNLSLGGNAVMVGNTVIQGRTEATGLGVGALVVAVGGASIAGNIVVGGNVGLGGNVGVSGNLVIGGRTEATGLGVGALVVAAGGASVAGNIVVGGNLRVQANTLLMKQVVANAVVESTSIGTGAWVVSAGGASVAGNVNVGGNVSVGNTLPTQTVEVVGNVAAWTGALLVAGGISAKGNLQVGGNVGIGGNTTVGVNAILAATPLDVPFVSNTLIHGDMVPPNGFPGTYTASASSFGGTGHDAFSAFNGVFNPNLVATNDAWTSTPGASGSPTYNSVNGTGDGRYLGTTVTNVWATHGATSITTVSGEWLQIQLPYDMSITGYQLMPRLYDLSISGTGSSPVGWTVVGSNDGTTWFVLDTQALATSYWATANGTGGSVGGGPSTFIVPRENANMTYRYVRIIVSRTNVGGAGGGTIGAAFSYTSIQQWNLLGFPLPNAARPALAVGGATHVFGNVRIAGGEVVTNLTEPATWGDATNGNVRLVAGGNLALVTNGNAALTVYGGTTLFGNVFAAKNGFVGKRFYVGLQESNTYALDVSGNDARLGAALITSLGTGTGGGGGAGTGAMMYLINQSFGVESGGTVASVASSYALAQTYDGNTFINAASGKTVQVSVGNGTPGGVSCVFSSNGFGVGTGSAGTTYMLDVLGNARIQSAKETTALGIGALVVSDGGSSIKGNVYVGGNVCLLNGNLGVGTTAPAYKVDVSGNVQISIATEATGSGVGALVVPNGGIGMGGNAYIGGNATVASTTDAGSGGTGALLVSNGGAYVKKSIYVAEAATVASSTDAGSGGTGALLVPNGGAYVKKSIYVADAATVASATDASSGGTGALLVPNGGAYVKQSIYVAAGATVASSTDASSNGTGALLVPNGGAYVKKKVYVADATAATSTAGALYVNGGVCINDNCYVNREVTATAYNATSDYRIKHDVRPLQSLNFTVDDLRPVYYTHSLTGKKEFGLLAHELQQIFPGLVQGTKDDPDTMQTVNYTGLIALLVHEVQTLKNQIRDIMVTSHQNDP